MTLDRATALAFWAALATAVAAAISGDVAIVFAFAAVAGGHALVEAVLVVVGAQEAKRRVAELERELAARGDDDGKMG